eukprot:jgi/Chlat1/2509/Chrsp175S02373
METASATAMVNGAMLAQHVGKKVRVVVKVKSFDNGRCACEAADGQEVFVRLAPGTSHYDTPFVEIQGTVQDPHTVEEEFHTPFGHNFELSTYNKLLELANNNYKQLFL